MTLWWISILLGAVVTVVVALLLAAILSEARKIEAGASRIWDVGQMIAGNTVHVPGLNHTNLFVEQIIAAVPGLLHSLERIREHAGECSSCPTCVVEGRP